MNAYLNDRQIPAFILILLVGFSTALLNDLGMLMLRSKSIFIRCVFDLFLTSAAAFGLFIAIYESGERVVRFYMICAFIMGAGIYGLIIRRPTEKAANHLFEKRKSTQNSE